VIAAGSLPPDLKQQDGWYATPEGVADNFAVNYALNDIQVTHARPLRVLEPSAGEGPAEVAAGMRRVRHAGNHRYCFPIGTPTDRRILARRLPPAAPTPSTCNPNRPCSEEDRWTTPSP
jgi:hypothetical protein